MKSRYALLTICLLAGCGARPDAPPAAAAPQATLEHIATARQVMLGLSIPAADVIWQLADHVPTDQAGWDRVAGTAAMLAESGNLLLTGPRNVNQPEWTQLSLELVARSKEAMAAAERKDLDAVLAAGDAIYGVCENCHNKYMPAKLAEAAEAAAAAKP